MQRFFPKGSCASRMALAFGGSRSTNPLHMVTITVDQLSKAFGTVQALDSVSLHIKPGEIFFLLGPSGCGKTTLLRTLAGFYQPDSGKICFDDVDVTQVPPHQRQTAMMFQSYALWPHLNVRNNIAFGLEQMKLPQAEVGARVEEALTTVQLEGLGDRSINALSGGQQQRVALARAVVVRPKCLFLDEPLSNLDAKLRLEMRLEIRRLCKEHGLTAVYVTHDQKEALSVADRMAILEDGRVAQVGTPQDVYRSPHSRSVAAFIGETNFIDGQIRRLDGCAIYVDTNVGSFEGRIGDSNWAPSKGDSVVLAIRPEALALRCMPSVDGGNTIDGHVIDGVYLGEIAQYRLKATDGTKIQASELNPSTMRESSDAWLHAYAAPENVVVLNPSTL